MPGRSSAATQLHVSRPEAASFNFVVRPQSKINPEEVRAQHPKQVVQDKHQKQVGFTALVCYLGSV